MESNVYHLHCNITNSWVWSPLCAVVVRLLNQLCQGAVLAQIVAVTEQHLCGLEHHTAGMRCPAVLGFLQ